jgi:hypothetical protein
MTPQVANLREVQRLSAQHSTAKWFTIDQIGNKLDGTLQDISALVRIIFPIPLIFLCPFLPAVLRIS